MDKGKKKNPNLIKLHIAIKVGDIEEVEEFLPLAGDVDIHAENQVERALLDYAILSGNIEVVKCLLAVCPDTATLEDKHVPRHLRAAVFVEDLELMSSLLTRAGIDARDRGRNTALHYAAFQGKRAAVQFLLSQKANVNAIGGYSSTPLNCAISGGHVEVVELLLKGGADIGAADVTRTPYTYLQQAILDNNLEIINLLLECSDIEAKDIRGKTALHYAASSENLEIVPLLLKNGANISVEDNEHKKPWRYAESEVIVRSLLPPMTGEPVLLFSRSAEVAEGKKSGEKPGGTVKKKVKKT